MRIDVYGKPGCAKCKSTKEKLSHYLKKWGVEGDVALQFVDMDTPDGMARGVFNDVYDLIPVTILVGDNDRPVGRWNGIVPPSGEVAKLLGVQAAETA
jgi:thiol-disulfide isomerase/thioredoxin